MPIWDATAPIAGLHDAFHSCGVPEADATFTPNGPGLVTGIVWHCDGDINACYQTALAYLSPDSVDLSDDPAWTPVKLVAPDYLPLFHVHIDALDPATRDMKYWDLYTQLTRVADPGEVLKVVRLQGKLGICVTYESSLVMQ